MPPGSEQAVVAPTHRVRWPARDTGGTVVPGSWVTSLEPPQVEEACLILKPELGRLVWVPLHTITGPIEIEKL